MDQFWIRFVIACCVVFLGEKLLGVLTLKPETTRVLTFILVIAAVVYVSFGQLLNLSELMYNLPTQRERG